MDCLYQDRKDSLYDFNLTNGRISMLSFIQCTRTDFGQPFYAMQYAFSQGQQRAATRAWLSTSPPFVSTYECGRIRPTCFGEVSQATRDPIHMATLKVEREVSTGDTGSSPGIVYTAKPPWHTQLGCRLYAKRELG